MAEPRAFVIEPYDRFTAGIGSIVDYEIRPKNTVTFLHAVDLTGVEALRAEAEARGSRRPSYTACVVKAVALALREFPYANRRLWGWWGLPFLSSRLQRFERRDVSVAVERDVPGVACAVFADVVRDADERSLEEITSMLAGFSGADEATSLQWRRFTTLLTRFPHALATLLIRLPVYFPGLWAKFRGCAAMVSSPARYGVDAVAATWTSPLGFSFGVVETRPVAKDGRVVSCPTFTLTLNFDRRVMAGAQAARFFRRVVEALETAGPTLREAAAPAAGEGPSWVLEPYNRYVSAHRRIVEREMRPQYTMSVLEEVDLTQAAALRERAKAAGKPPPSYTAFVAKAAARALRDVPEANARVWGWPGVPLFRTRVQRFHRLDVAVAVERSVPNVEVATFIDVIRDVDGASLDEITKSLHALATGGLSEIRQWREFSTLLGRLPTWLSPLLVSMPLSIPALWRKYRGGAVLISSPAKYGVDAITGTWPWALGISFGVVRPRPAVSGGRLVVRPSCVLTLNFDRRLLGVGEAARFFRRLVSDLEAQGEPAAAAPAAEAGDVRPYTIDPRSPFVSATRAMVDFEIGPQRTVTFLQDVDLTEIEEVRAEIGRRGGPVPSHTAFVVKAVALALKDFPFANRRVVRSRIPLRGPRLQRFEQRDVAVAVEGLEPGVAEAGLVRHADERSLEEIARDLETFGADERPSPLSTFAHRRPVRRPDHWVDRRGGAALVLPPGEDAADALTGAWGWPLGIAFGAMRLRPAVRAGAPVPCPTFTLTLAWDRRVMAGAQSARFFRRITDALENARAELLGPRPAGFADQVAGDATPVTASTGSRPTRAEGADA